MLSYRIEGEGPPLLLIHGFGVSFKIWQNLVPLLSPHFKLIMIELPGINASPLPPAGERYYQACGQAIKELRQCLGISQWSVLAYSAGSRAGEAYLQQDAAHVKDAVMLCPVMVAPPAAAFLRFLAWLNRRWPAFTHWLVSGWRFYTLIVLLSFNGSPHACAADWIAEIDRQPIPIRIAMFADLPGFGGARLELPPLPVHLIWGRYDLISQPFWNARPGDTVISANHAAPMLAAPLVAEAVLTFFRR